MSNQLQHSLPLPEPVGIVTDCRPLYRRFVRPGDLAFDIGAHVGERSRALLALGCEVVAVEPQPGMLRVPPDPLLHALEAVCSDHDGVEWFYPCAGNTYMSTIMGDYRSAVQIHAASFGGYGYGEPVEVCSVTLDWLISEYGLPSFVKIDVEGAEAKVLAGLSTPVEALSFEVHDFDPGKMGACVALLDALGEYEYFYSETESFLLQPGLPERLKMFGDVYARLKT